MTTEIQIGDYQYCIKPGEANETRRVETVGHIIGGAEREIVLEYFDLQEKYFALVLKIKQAKEALQEAKDEQT